MASRNTSCPFQRANVATRPIRTRPSSGGRPASAARSSVDLPGEKVLRDRPRCGCGRAAPPARTRSPRPTARSRSWRRSRRRGARAGAADASTAAAAHVVVQVPDETHAGGLDQRRGDVRLEAVAVNDGRTGVAENRAQPLRYPGSDTAAASACQRSAARQGRTARLDRAALAQRGQRRRKRQLDDVEAAACGSDPPAAPAPASRP